MPRETSKRKTKKPGANKQNAISFFSALFLLVYRTFQPPRILAQKIAESRLYRTMIGARLGICRRMSFAAGLRQAGKTSPLSFPNRSGRISASKFPPIQNLVPAENPRTMARQPLLPSLKLAPKSHPSKRESLLIFQKLGLRRSFFSWRRILRSFLSSQSFPQSCAVPQVVLPRWARNLEPNTASEKPSSPAICPKPRK